MRVFLVFFILGILTPINAFCQSRISELESIWEDSSNEDLDRVKAWVSLTNEIKAGEHQVRLMREMIAAGKADTLSILYDYGLYAEGFMNKYVLKKPSIAERSFKHVVQRGDSAASTIARLMLGRTQANKERYETLKPAIAYVFSQPIDELPMEPFFGPLYQRIFSYYGALLRDQPKKHVDFLKRQIAYFESSDNFKEEALMVKASAGGEIWRNHKLKEEAVYFYNEAIKDLGSSEEDNVLKSTYLQHIQAIKNGSPMRVSSKPACVQKVPIRHASPQALIVLEEESYSREHYSIQAIDSLISFIGDTTLRADFLPPVEIKVELDTLTISPPEKREALPGVFPEGGIHNIKHLGSDQGLPEGIGNVQQDSKGNIWIIATGKLIRYDGNFFYYYGTDQGFPDTFYHSFVIDHEGQLWLASDDGLIRFDGIHAFLYKNFRSSFLYCDREGKIWATNASASAGIRQVTDTAVYYYKTDQGFPERVLNMMLCDDVTVLFTDFKGFTAMSEKVSPKQLVKDLHECFSAFDEICGKHGIEKIKTIGDAYMAAGGIPVPNQTHAHDIVQAALEMRDFVQLGKQRKIEAGLPYFEIRIGIHTGPVVAGIVGVKKFQYDIWGDTVNTASRMESSGEVGKVNISNFTHDQLRKDAAFTFEKRGKITAKGKGELEMWFVEPA